MEKIKSILLCVVTLCMLLVCICGCSQSDSVSNDSSVTDEVVETEEDLGYDKENYKLCTYEDRVRMSKDYVHTEEDISMGYKRHIYIYSASNATYENDPVYRIKKVNMFAFDEDEYVLENMIKSLEEEHASFGYSDNVQFSVVDLSDGDWSAVKCITEFNIKDLTEQDKEIIKETFNIDDLSVLDNTWDAYDCLK